MSDSKLVPETWLSREVGISVDDAEWFFTLLMVVSGQEKRVRVQDLSADGALSTMWLVHRGLVLTEDLCGVLYVFPSDKGREAAKSAERSARAAKRIAARSAA